MSFFASVCFLSFLVIFHWSRTFANTCSSCTSMSFNVKNGLKDRALEDQRRLKNTIVENDSQCFSECSQDCRCMSFNVCGKSCQLNGANRFLARQSLRTKTGCSHYDFPTSESTCETKSSGPPGVCCARMSPPCFNGGSCDVNITDTTRRFICKCPSGFYGDQCQITKPKTCLDYWTGPIKPISRGYTIEDQSGNPYPVYCDFDSEDGIAWTLIQTFTLGKESEVKNQPFTVDRPLNENNFNWYLFRLSKSNMADIRSRSTFWRATCSYATYGVDYKDYVRVQLSVFDPMKDIANACFQIDFIDVKGTSCVNCTVLIFQKNDDILHLTGYYGRTQQGCSFDSTNVDYQCPSSIERARLWGGYHWCIDPSSRCSESSSSTTEHWFGRQKS